MQSGTGILEVGVPLAVLWGVEKLVAVIFVARNGMTNGVVESFAGRTVAQVRAAIRNLGFSVSKEPHACLNGELILGNAEKRILLNPGDELWLGGWRPP